MSEIESIADELFFKLRNRFPRIQMGDESGQSTSSPSDGRFFNFDYIIHGNAYGTVTCSLIDNQVLKVFFSQDITEQMDEHTEEDWFQLLRELRKFAKAHMLMFDVRDITKDTLDQKDIEFVSQYHKEKSEVSESRVMWNRRGRFSEGNQESIRIHVVHKNKLEENPNNRLSQIDKIYLVNSKQERFLMPFTSVTGAKAMAHHTAKGGTPYDEGGLVIGRAVAEMKNLQRFALSNRNRQFESEDPQRVLEAIKHIREAMRGHVLKMAENRDFDEHLTELTKLTKLSDARVNEDIKGWFMQNTFNENYDAWIESAANAYHKYEEMMMNETNDDGIPSKDMTDVRRANPAKVGNTVQLYMDPNKDKEMQELIRSQPMRGMVRLILADIAKRAVDDEVAILASKADEGEMTQRHLAMIKSYIHDLYSGNPDRTAPAAKKDIHGKVKSPEEEFESTIMGMGETGEEEMDESRAQSEEDQMAEELDALLIAGGDYDELLRLLAKKYKTQPEVVEYNYEQWLESPIQAEGQTDEGNAFSGAMAAARAAGHDHFEVDGKHYDVTNEGSCNMTSEGTMCPVHGMEECWSGGGMMESDSELNDMRRLSGLAEQSAEWPFQEIPRYTKPTQPGTDPAPNFNVFGPKTLNRPQATPIPTGDMTNGEFAKWRSQDKMNNPADYEFTKGMQRYQPEKDPERALKYPEMQAMKQDVFPGSAKQDTMPEKYRGTVHDPATPDAYIPDPQSEKIKQAFGGKYPTKSEYTDAYMRDKGYELGANKEWQMRGNPPPAPTVTKSPVDDMPIVNKTAPTPDWTKMKPDAPSAPSAPAGQDADEKPYSPPLYIKPSIPMSESDSLTTMMKLAGLRK